MKIEIHPKVAYIQLPDHSGSYMCVAARGIVVNDDVIWPVGIVWTKFYFDNFVWMLMAAWDYHATATEPRLQNDTLSSGSRPSATLQP